MASLFDTPVLGGLFDVESGPERQALNMGLLGLGLGMLESGKFSPGVRNFQSLYQSGLQSGQAAEDRQREKEQREAVQKSLQQALAPSGTQLADAGGQGVPSAPTLTEPQRRAILTQSQFDPFKALEMYNEILLQPAPQPTDDIREYEFAKSQGFQGTFQDFLTAQRKAGASNVSVSSPNIGTIPQGYELVRDGDRWSMVPIEGGPAAREIAATQEAAAASTAAKTRTADIVTQDIDRALGALEESPNLVAGPGGALFSNVPGTPARDFRALVDTVRANIGFDKLQAMREASPTGGALGQVSQQENALLQATFGNLEQSQTPEQLAYNLKRVKNVYLDIIHGPGNGPPREQLSVEGGGDLPIAQMSAADLGMIDINTLTREQQDALDKRLQELGY